MTTQPWRARLGRVLDDRGNVAVVVALAVVPLATASLGAADVARAISARSQLQDAIDVAALGAARSPATTDAELQAAGQRFLTQNLRLDSDFRLTRSSFRFGAGGTVVASAQAEVTPMIAGLVTGGPLQVSASSEVVRANMKVEIAMVLDTTLSMLEGDKLEDMKDAAVAFVNKMEAAADKSPDPEAVKISLVPFSHTVRVDPNQHRHDTWLDQDGSSPINNEIFTTANGTQYANRFSLFSALGTSWRGCVEMRQAPYDIQDTPPTSGATLYTPYFYPDEPDYRTPGYGQDYQNDYLSDRTDSTNWRVRQGSITKYRSTSGLGVNKGPNKGCGLSPVRRLSTSFSTIRSAIRNLEADGNTNIPIGLAWGWNTLAPHAPFGDGAAYNAPKMKKIVVLMTDGENTIAQRDTPNDGTYAATGYIWQGRVLKEDGDPLEQGASSSERTAALDSRLSKLCANMKAKGIEIYTIRVEVRTGSSELLQNCATSRDHFYDVRDSDQLTVVFQNIAGQIAALRLAR